VGICERREVVGGVCINTGTIPSKTFREAVLYLTGYQQRGIYGPGYRVKEDITMAELLPALRPRDPARGPGRPGSDAPQRSEAHSRARPPSWTPIACSSPARRRSIEVRAEKIVIAVGTVPSVPEGTPVDGETIITSDDILHMPSVPHTMTIVGAGVIGTEYASIFAALGT
jgi:NAD(P) transhydrogenase